MKMPWNPGGPLFEDDPLTLKNWLDYYKHQFRMRTSKKYRDRQARFEDLIRTVALSKEVRK